MATVFVVMITAASTLAIASGVPRKKTLSQTSVTIDSGPNAVDGALFIAVAQDLFARFGVKATWLNDPNSGASSVTTILGGAAQFTFTTASNEIIAAQQGAPLRGLLIPSVGGPQQVVITNAAAAAHNIPTNGGSEKNTLAQLKALKGSHITVAVATTSGNAYIWLATEAHAVGLTIAPNCSTCDINAQVVGTVPNEVAGYDAGKFEGIANVPPYTTQPNSVLIQYAKAEPLSSTLTTFVATTLSEIQQHPDTVQAVVDGFVYTMQVWRKAHKALAEQDIETVLENAGSTPSQAAYSTKVQEIYFKNPYPTRFEYNTTLATYNLNWSLSSSTPYTLPYSTFVVPRFVLAALKSLRLPT